MSQHDYNTTRSTFYHTTANASGNNQGASQLAVNLAKLDAVQIKFEEFHLHLKYVMLKADLQQTLNKLLEQDGDIIKVFVNQIRMTTKPRDRNTSKMTDSDIFDGHTLLVCILCHQSKLFQ